ncbi:MAG: hypothetical protein VKM17_01165 [Cyanobacteriota bacterium]|nr:hypothetical protein [Cyanobacteriota bacterium]
MPTPNSRQTAPLPLARGGLARGCRLLGGLAWTLAGFLVTISPAPARAAADTLQGSQEMRKQFPFQANCNGNTQEMVACLWERRNREDRVLGALLGEKERLEDWRASRRRVCEVAARKAEGGSTHPIVWLSCENALNRELLRLLKQPLLHNADS